MEIVLLSEIKLNEANPRNISDGSLDQLIDSLLLFPKMMQLRPIVLAHDNTILGGNMRFKALTAISQMYFDELKVRLMNNRKFEKLTSTERTYLFDHWTGFINKPCAPVLHAANLSEDEYNEFIIKDNVGFGHWDFDMLRREWDVEDLESWGLDIPKEIESYDDDSDDTPASIDTKLIVECGDVTELEKLFEELQKRGFTCKLKE